MPVRLITGLPGHGKTLLMISELVSAAKVANRPLYQAGIDGLAPGLAETLQNARDWNAIDPTKEGTCECGKRPPHAHVIPDGALIFVDEAWKWFGHLHDARGQQTPPAVLDLAEHRHRGIDFVWTTQAPSQIYPFARALIAEHSHVVRVFGTHNAKVFTWGELNEDVKSRAMREHAIGSFMRFDPALFAQYKSATTHTIKRSIPWRVAIIPAAIIASIVVGFFGWKAIHHIGQPATTATASTATNALRASSPASTASGAADASKQQTKWATVDDYVKDHTARMIAKPWSAPVYDGRAITTDPRLLCMIDGDSHDVKASTCNCYTEQATPYPGLTDQQCRLFAKQGVYDPYAVPSAPAVNQPQGAAVSGAHPGRVADASAVVAGAGAFGTLAHYGAIHDQAAPTAPESYGDGEGLK